MGSPQDVASMVANSETALGDLSQAAEEPQSGRGKTTISIPSPAVADDDKLVWHIKELVNDVYAKEEEGIWDEKAKYNRTNTEEIRQYLRAGELALVWRCPAASGAATGSDLLLDPSSCVGCGRFSWMAPQQGHVGLIALHESLRGMGIGRALMRFGEDHFKSRGAIMMQIELLIPETWTHPSKARLDAWYLRLGYKMVRMEAFDIKYPHLAPPLAGPSLLKIWEKAL